MRHSLMRDDFASICMSQAVRSCASLGGSSRTVQAGGSGRWASCSGTPADANEINGARLQMQACKFIEENLAIKVDTLGKDALINCAKTAMSSKIIGGADEDFFSKMAVDAMLAVKTTTPEGKAR